MQKWISKITNVTIYLIIILMAVNIMTKYKANESVKFPIGLWYVYSESMEPTLMTNDGFILIQSKSYKVNDVITFKPKVLKQPLVTHRIVEATEDNKFITKGDNNPMTDQQGGEPYIEFEQIVGRAVCFNNNLVVIPKLGIISNKLKTIIKNLNIFSLLAIITTIYLFEYILFNVLRSKKISNKKYRLIDIAPFCDYIFWLFCIILISSGFLIGITLNSWKTEQVSYVVVSTDGLPSPMPNERFTEVRKLENSGYLPFVIMIEPENPSVNISPHKLVLSAKEHSEYTLSLIAPNKIGNYIETIRKRVYLKVLPAKWFDALYSRNIYYPVLIMFTPIVITAAVLLILWLKRWRVGTREVMPWLIRLRIALRSKA